MNKKLFCVITLLACALLLLTAVSCKMDAFTGSTTEPEVTATGKSPVQYSIQMWKAKTMVELFLRWIKRTD